MSTRSRVSEPPIEEGRVAAGQVGGCGQLWCPSGVGQRQKDLLQPNRISLSGPKLQLNMMQLDQLGISTTVSGHCERRRQMLLCVMKPAAFPFRSRQQAT